MSVERAASALTASARENMIVFGTVIYTSEFTAWMSA
jgi:hypothetical protein